MARSCAGQPLPSGSTSFGASTSQLASKKPATHAVEESSRGTVATLRMTGTISWWHASSAHKLTSTSLVNLDGLNLQKHSPSWKNYPTDLIDLTFHIYQTLGLVLLGKSYRNGLSYRGFLAMFPQTDSGILWIPSSNQTCWFCFRTGVRPVFDPYSSLFPQVALFSTLKTSNWRYIRGFLQWGYPQIIQVIRPWLRIETYVFSCFLGIHKNPPPPTSDYHGSPIGDPKKIHPETSAWCAASGRWSCRSSATKSSWMCLKLGYIMVYLMALK
jgi:hypothetical protein